MSRRRPFATPPRGRIVTPILGVTVPAVAVVPPRFTHAYVRVITYQRQRVFSPPLSIATILAPFVHRVGRPPMFRLARGRISQFIPATPTAGPGPLVPQFRRTRVISLRGLRTPHRGSVPIVPPPPPPPPPLPGKPQSSGGIVKDYLHWWRTGAEY